ncbi:MAG: sigma-70 family RNA polymerase sigma factor [Acidobacteria bacterium]|nr:sigma-70 family RNA polymerase sigma factor [Acidobacteriota bacterium]
MNLLHTDPHADSAAESDEHLQRRCNEGDQEAWELLIRKYRNLIYSIPIRLGLSQEDANEIFQETCLSLLAELPHIREPKTLAAWLIKVTLRKCSRFRRNNSRLPLDPSEDALERIVSPDNPAGLLAEAQRVHVLRESILELGSRCRTLIQRLFLTVPPEPYETVARTLGIPNGSIGFNRMRCLHQLRHLLEERGF